MSPSGVARPGLPTAWSGRVGADDLGEAVPPRIRGADVDVGAAVRDSELPTSLMIKEQPLPRGPCG